MGRITDYSHLPQEAPALSDARSRPPENWPQKGTIAMSGVNLQYPNQKFHALKDIEMEVEAGEKVVANSRQTEENTSYMYIDKAFVYTSLSTS